MRWVASLLLAAGVAAANPVYLDDSFPPSTRPTLQTLADTIWDIVQEMFHASPPLDFPIDVRHARSGAPLTSLDDYNYPTTIRIRLTSSGTHYSQFAYQLGHELGHVMLDPRRSDGTIEAICNAVSYEVLDRLSERLPEAATLSWLVDYAPHFREYRQQDQDSALAKFPPGVRTMVDEQHWSDLAGYLHTHQRDMQPGQHNERAMQTLAAIALRSAPLDWGQLAGLAGCTTPAPDQDPKFEILPIDESCRKQDREILCRIGESCDP